MASTRALLISMALLGGACSGGAAPAVAPTPPAGAAPAAVPPAEPTAAAPEAPDAPTPIADAYRDVAARILDAALADDGAWQKLEHLTTQIGARLSGSKELERAVAWAVEVMEKEGHENVRAEKVMVPHWVRGAEEAELVAPYRKRMNILGLGGTVATKGAGLTAEVVVARSFEHLEELGNAVKGKIVLFNARMPEFDRDGGDAYEAVMDYRTKGASAAARQGAVGTLLRSITTRSLDTPHTGSVRYADDAPKIPAAAVTIEDAELIDRLTRAGTRVRVRLKTSGRFLPDAESANVLAELRGRERPDELVVIGCHLDSWDVGQGAHDDGGGCVMMMQALTILRRLELRPRRTIRVVLWTNEENGMRGAFAYVKEHAAELPNHVLAMEADSGAFHPRGFQLASDDAQALADARDIASLLAPIGATEIKGNGFAGVDVLPLIDAGVLAMGLWMEEVRYFDYHHTAADTLDKVDPSDLAKDVAAMAVVAYVVADMPRRFGAPPAAGAEP